MLLGPDGVQLTGPDLLQAVADCPLLSAASAAYFASEVHVIHRSQHSLHVLQGEQALVDFGLCRQGARASGQDDDGDASASASRSSSSNSGEEGMYLGSTEATTCVIAVVVCALTQHAWVAHFDEGTARTAATPTGYLASAAHFLPEADLYLLGACCDDAGVGNRTARQLLDFFHTTAPGRYMLRLAAIGAVNTAADGGPQSRQLAVHCPTGAAHPAAFEDRGPELARRGAALFCRARPACLAAVWDTWRGLLTLPAVLAEVVQLSANLSRNLRACLALDDGELLRQCSTTPLHESALFVGDLRAGFAWLLGVQQGRGAVAAPALQFRWSGAGEGGWQPAAGGETANA